MKHRLSGSLIGLALVVAACGGTTTKTPDTVAPSTSPTTAVTPQTVISTTAGPAPSTTASPPPVPTTTTPPTTTAATRADAVIESAIADGVITSPDRPEVALGSTVLVIVTADVADEVHIHGYDYFLDLTPRATAEIEFIADIPGIFEVELEDSHRLLFELVVR